MPRTSRLALAVAATALLVPSTAFAQSRPAAGAPERPAGRQARAGRAGAARQRQAQPPPGAAGGAAAQASNAGVVARSLSWMIGTWVGNASIAQSDQPVRIQIDVTPEFGGSYLIARTQAQGPAARLLDDMTVIGLDAKARALAAWRFGAQGETTQETVAFQASEGVAIFEGGGKGWSVRRTFSRSDEGVTLTVERITGALGDSETLLDAPLRKLPPAMAARLQKAQARRGGAEAAGGAAGAAEGGADAAEGGAAGPGGRRPPRGGGGRGG